MKNIFKKISSGIICLSFGLLLFACVAAKPAPDTEKTKENAKKSFDSLNKEENNKHHH